MGGECSHHCRKTLSVRNVFLDLIYVQRSATLSPLDDNDWVAVQSMILQQEENHILDKLEG